MEMPLWLARRGADKFPMMDSSPVHTVRPTLTFLPTLLGRCGRRRRQNSRVFTPKTLNEGVTAGGRAFARNERERFRGLDNFGVVLIHVIQERYPIKMSQLAFHIRIDAKQHNEENLK